MKRVSESSASILSRQAATACTLSLLAANYSYHSMFHGVMSPNVRFCSTGKSENTPSDFPSGAGSSLPRKAAMEAAAKQAAAPQGVVELSSLNINQEMESKVPMFLYFTVNNHPDVVEYTQKIIHQVDQVNRRMKNENDMGEVYSEFGKDRGLAIKLGIVDCVKEPGLTKKFAVDPHLFPIIYFVRNRSFVDKLYGITPESQIKEAIEAFIEYAIKECKDEKEGKSLVNRLKRSDNDDENPMTLLQEAHKNLQSRKLQKAKKLFQKALDMSCEEQKQIAQRYGLENKKITLEIWKKLKREPCYNSAPQALCGLGMCELANNQHQEALVYAQQVRKDYPFAVADLRDVAQAVVRIEILQETKFDVEKDNYSTLLKFDELVKDPVEFYNMHLKLAVAHFAEGSARQSIEECLRLIRAEPKLLPALKEGGVLAPDFQLRPGCVTPARYVILKLFEAFGDDDEHVIEGRKMLQLYT